MLDKTLVTSISKSYTNGKSIRRNLGHDSKIVIDQKLPYICVYRFTGSPDPFITSLLRTQGSYLVLHAEFDAGNLIEALINVAIKDFRSFLVIELWNNAHSSEENIFELFYPGQKITPPVEALQKGFTSFKNFLPDVKVIPKGSDNRHPEEFPPLIPLDKMKETGALLLGIAIPGLIGYAGKASSFPLFFRITRRKFAETIKQAAFEFMRMQSDNSFKHYLAMGKTRLDNLLRSADKKMASISEEMDFLMKVTPVNSLHEWETFKKNKYKKLPQFTYRLITIDPEIEKRKLFSIPIEKIDHPTLAFLLREKRMELEKQLIMLEERGTKNFYFTSESLYGQLNQKIKNTAIALLNDRMPNEQKEISKIDATTFARAAESELNIYRESFPQLKLKAKISAHVSGLIVSGPELNIGTDLNISSRRLDALLQHEVGTHILTWCNGHLQPLRLMYAGFAGYEQLQEGIAVFSEYLVGGLNINRLKMLAARVMAVDCVTNGADFIETFDMLRNDYGFTPKTAFNISMRVHRGGGYTKDAIYLKGLIQLLDFIKDDGDITQLYGGKFALEHLPLMQELIHLNIIKRPVLPAYLKTDAAKSKIEKVRNGITLNELVN